MCTLSEARQASCTQVTAGSPMSSKLSGGWQYRRPCRKRSVASFSNGTSGGSVSRNSITRSSLSKAWGERISCAWTRNFHGGLQPLRYARPAEHGRRSPIKKWVESSTSVRGGTRSGSNFSTHYLMASQPHLRQHRRNFAAARGVLASPGSWHTGLTGSRLQGNAAQGRNSPFCDLGIPVI